MKYVILTVLVAIASLFFLPTQAHAQCSPAVPYDIDSSCVGQSPGGCSEGFVCEIRPTADNGCVLIRSTSRRCGTGSIGTSVLGGVPRPAAVASYNYAAGGGGIGIVIFISNLLTIFAVVAGLWVLVNIIRAAYMFITGMGDPGTFQKVQELATMSGIGVAIIAGAYILAGLIGLILFGDAAFILSPTLQGALD